jgi:hypothetical protein
MILCKWLIKQFPKSISSCSWRKFKKYIIDLYGYEYLLFKHEIEVDKEGQVYVTTTQRQSK